MYQKNNDGYAWVILNEKHGLLSAEGTVLVPAEYEDIFFYEDGIAAVMLDKKWGFIDSDNNVIEPFEYDYISHFSNGLARVVISEDGFVTAKLDGLFRTIDKNGKVIKQGANVKDDK